MNKSTPVGRFVEVTAPPSEPISTGGIYVPDHKAYIEATVISIGDKVAAEIFPVTLKVGSKIMYTKGAAFLNGGKLFVNCYSIDVKLK